MVRLALKKTIGAARSAPRWRSLPTLLLLLAVGWAAPAPRADARRVDALRGKADSFVVSAAAVKSRRVRVGVVARVDGQLTPERKARLRKIGAYVYRNLSLIDSVAISVPSSHLERFARLDFVKRVSLDAEVKKLDQFTVASSGADVAYSRFKLTGRDVSIAIVDSGIRPSLALEDPTTSTSRIVTSISFVSDAATREDACGHGTHVAGIAAGNGAYSTSTECFRSFYGIARKANLVNVHVLNDQGVGTVSSAVAGLQWIKDNRTTYNIRIVNLSFGHPVGESYKTDPLCQAVAKLWKIGIVVVCAAGNEGRLFSTASASSGNEGWGTAYGTIQSPANSPYAITVGASRSVDGTRLNDRIATYSARGPSRLDFVLKPDIIAPGNRVISLNAHESFIWNNYATTNGIPYSYYRTDKGDALSIRYITLSGTSMAAPVVAGAAAMMLERDPSLTPDTIKARLMITADKWANPDGTLDPFTFGAGYVNIAAALTSTVVATKYAVSPSLTRDTSGKVYVNVADLLQGGDTIWGIYGVPDNQLVWGNVEMWGAQLVWGNQLIWGNNSLAGSQLVWGNQVWNDQLVWGNAYTHADLSAASLFGD